MNERIQLLAEQAGCAWWEGRALRDMSQCHHELEKFAELIVQECLTVVGKTPLGYRDYRNQIEEGMCSACVDSLKEHFGVE